MSRQLHADRRTGPPLLPALALGVAATSLAGCAVSHPPEVASAGATTVGDTASALPTVASTAPESVTTTTAPRGLTGSRAEVAVERAWVASINDFYRASELGSTNLSSLDATLLPGSLEVAQETGFISAQVASGVVGPSTWRIGNVRVVSLAGDAAVITACSYDPGSHFRATGRPAPASLGGGARLTAYVSHLEDVAGRWLLYATDASEPMSASEAGPCLGF